MSLVHSLGALRQGSNAIAIPALSFPPHTFFWSTTTCSLQSLPCSSYRPIDELYIFPPSAYRGSLKPDNPISNDFLREQSCVENCDFVMSRIKKPIRMREHFVSCKWRKIQFAGKDDPLARLCAAQIIAQRFLLLVV